MARHHGKRECSEAAGVHCACRGHGGCMAARRTCPNAAEDSVDRVAYYSAGSRTASAHLVEAFLHGLRELDYVEGQTFVMEYRLAEGRQERLPELAVELVRLELDVLVAPTSAAVQAAMYATRRSQSSWPEAAIPSVSACGEPRAARRQRDGAEHDEYRGCQQTHSDAQRGGSGAQASGSPDELSQSDSCSLYAGD